MKDEAAAAGRNESGGGKDVLGLKIEKCFRARFLFYEFYESNVAFLKE